LYLGLAQRKSQEYMITFWHTVNLEKSLDTLLIAEKRKTSSVAIWRQGQNFGFW